MFCEKCGMSMEEENKFCPGCGAPVSCEEETTVLEENNPQEDTTEDVNDLPVSENEEMVADAEEIEPNNESPEISAKPSVIYCTNCGSEMSIGDKVCSMCGNPYGEVAKKNPMKFLSKTVIISIVAVILLAIFAISNFAFAKNAVMKLVLSPEKYLAYVISSNADDFQDTFATQMATAKDNTLGGAGAKAEIELKKGKGLEELLSNVDADEVIDYIDWFKSTAVSFEANTKDNVTGVNAGIKLNGVDFGKMDTVVDMNNMMTYIGLPDYNPEYVGADMGYSYYDFDESMEVISGVMEAMPDKKDTKKLLKKYLDVVLNSVEEVDEQTKTIQADNISQKVTSLSLDVDGRLMKNISINFLNELKNDQDLNEIINNIADVSDMDIDDFWEEVDYAIEELEELDYDDFDYEISLEIFVNSNGEIAGFAIDTEDGSFTSYVAEKGNKFGALVEMNFDGTIRLEGNGKQFNNKKSGEFELAVMGTNVVKFDIKDLDTQKLRKGLFDGKLTIKCADGLDALRYVDSGIDREILDILPSLGITIKSSQKSIDSCDCTISLDYKDEPSVELILKSDTRNAEKVKIPSDYVNADDYYASEEWGKNFDFSKLIDKMREAGFPNEIVDTLENNIDYMF